MIHAIFIRYCTIRQPSRIWIYSEYQLITPVAVSCQAADGWLHPSLHGCLIPQPQLVILLREHGVNSHQWKDNQPSTQPNQEEIGIMRRELPTWWPKGANTQPSVQCLAASSFSLRTAASINDVNLKGPRVARSALWLEETARTQGHSAMRRHHIRSNPLSYGRLRTDNMWWKHLILESCQSSTVTAR